MLRRCVGVVVQSFTQIVLCLTRSHSLTHLAIAQTRPSIVFVMSDLSLNGFVNVGKLEDVLQTLMQKMVRCSAVPATDAYNTLPVLESSAHRLHSFLLMFVCVVCC